MFKRAKGRQAAYDRLNNRIEQEPVNRKPKLTSESGKGEVAELKHHAKGLGRPRIAYARMIARARKDDFYDGIRVAQGV